MKNDYLSNLRALSVRQLLMFRKSNLGQKYYYLELMKECDNIEKQIEKQLAKKCNHQWKRYPPTQMYEGTTTSCTICNLDKKDVRYMNSN